VAQLLYVGVFAVFGCWLAGRLAPGRPMAHALGVGVLGMILNVASAWTMRDGHPAWYLAVGVATTMLWAWIGGRLARGAGAAPARAVA
jgi:Co/Zn/Cd efflux system component